MGLGTVSGPSTDHLSALLADVAAHPTRWEFFALGRSVEQVRPDAPLIGTALDPAEELVDWTNQPSVDFPRTTVAGYEPEGRRPRVRSQQIGLLGTMGPMPLHLTEAAIVERRGGQPTPFTDFIDLISARMLQGFYRAWANGNPCAQADRPADDRFAGMLAAVSGSAGLRFVTGSERPDPEATGFDGWRRLAYSGQLAGLRSAAAVADVLAHVLGRAVTVEEAVGRWRAMPADARTRIGGTGAHGRLGLGATLGARFFAVEWDVGLSVRVRSMAELDELLPGGDAHALLVEAAAAVLPPYLAWSTTIEIDEAAVAPARLSRDGGARLGMTGWIAPRGRRQLRRDVRIAGTGRAQERKRGEA